MLRRTYTKKEKRIILLGHFCRWGCVILPIGVTLIVFSICKLLNTTIEVRKFASYLSIAVNTLIVGVYHIIGTTLEFKHVLVSLQLSCKNPFANIDPSRAWEPSEKRDGIGTGVIFIVLGLLTLFALFLTQG